MSLLLARRRASHRNLKFDFEHSLADAVAADPAFGAVSRFVYDPTKNLAANPEAEVNTGSVAAPASTSDGVVSRVTNSSCPASNTAFRVYYPENPSRSWRYVSFNPVSRPWLSGETWTITFWLRAITGVHSANVSLMDGNAANNNGTTSYMAVTNDGVWRRFSKSFTVGSNPTSTNVIYFSFGGTTAEQELEITAVQLEKGTSTQPWKRSGTGFLQTSRGSRIPVPNLTPGSEYTPSAYIFPQADGEYSIGLASAPTPYIESGPGRRYAKAKNGPGVLVEEATVNLIPWPTFAGAGNMSSPAQTTVTVDDDRRFVPSGSSRKVTLNTSGNMPTFWAGATPVVPSTSYTASVYVWTPVAKSVRLLVDLYSAGPTYQTVSAGPTVSVPANTWTRLVHTVTTPSNVVQINTNVQGQGTWNVGESFWAHCLQVEKQSYATSFVDGSLGSGYSYVSTNNLIANPSFETDTSGWEGLNKNLLTADQSSVETNTTGWYAVTNCSIARSTAQALAGSSSLAITAAAAGDVLVVTSTNANATPVVPSQVYTATMSIRAASTARAVVPRIYWYTDSGTYIGYVDGQTSADHASGWTQMSIAAQAPSNAAKASVAARALNCAAGEVHYVDAVGLFETPNGNLFPGGGNFEGGTDNWGPDIGSPTVTWSTEQSYTGVGSLKATNSSSTSDCAVGIISQSVPVVAGTPYTFSAWVRPSYAANLRADTAGAMGSLISAPANVWTRVSITFTPSSSSNSQPLYIHALGAVTPSSTVYIDAVQVVKGSTALDYIPPTTTNLVTNSSFEVGTTGWSGATRTTSTSYVGTSSSHATTGSAGVYAGTSYNTEVQPSIPYTFSTYVRRDTLDTGGADRLAISIIWYNSAGTVVGESPRAFATAAVNTWERLSVSGTSPATAVRCMCRVFVDSSTTARAYWVDAAQLEFGSVATPYVDGSLGAGYSWDSSNNLISNPSFETDTIGWNINGNCTIARSTLRAANGTASLEMSSTAAGANASVSSNSEHHPRVAPGSVYTVSGYLWTATPRACEIRINWLDASNALLGSTTSHVTPAASTWTRIVNTGVAPSGATRVQILLVANASQTGELFYWDAIQFEQRPFVTPFGQTGAANLSSSTRRTPWVLGGTSVETLNRTLSSGATGPAHGGAYVSLGMSAPTPAVNYRLGVATTVAVSASTTYSLSQYTMGAAAIRLVDAVSGAVLLDSSALTSANLSTNRSFRTFTTGAGQTSLRIEYIINATRGGYGEDAARLDFFRIDAVQLEQRDYVTPFGVGTHGGVAGYPSSRERGRLYYMNVDGSATLNSGVSVVATARYNSNGGGTWLHTDFGRNNVTLLRVEARTDGNVFARIYAAGAGNTGNVTVSIGSLSDGDTVMAVGSFDGSTLRITASKNGGSAVTSTVSAIGNADVFDLIGIAYNYYNGGGQTGRPHENVMAFSTALAPEDAANIATGATLPSAAANRSDCVFAAFINDSVAAPVPLTAGSWQKIARTQKQVKNTRSDIVILGPDGSGPFYVDSIKM